MSFNFQSRKQILTLRGVYIIIFLDGDVDAADDISGHQVSQVAQFERRDLGLAHNGCTKPYISSSAAQNPSYPFHHLHHQCLTKILVNNELTNNN